MKIKGVSQDIVDIAYILGIVNNRQIQQNEWGLVQNSQSITQLKRIHNAPLDCFKARWYQCDVIRKSGERDFLYRFIADSDKRATIKVFFKVRNELTGSPANNFYYLAAKHYVKTFDIYKVPDTILEKYNLNIGSEVNLFYEKAKG